MKYAHALILALFLVTAFCIFFGWCLYKSCRRVIDAQALELTNQQDIAVEAAINGRKPIEETDNGATEPAKKKK